MIINKIHDLMLVKMFHVALITILSFMLINYLTKNSISQTVYITTGMIIALSVISHIYVFIKYYTTHKIFYKIKFMVKDKTLHSFLIEILLYNLIVEIVLTIIAYLNNPDNFNTELELPYVLISTIAILYIFKPSKDNIIKD